MKRWKCLMVCAVLAASFASEVCQGQTCNSAACQRARAAQMNGYAPVYVENPVYAMREITIDTPVVRRVTSAQPVLTPERPSGHDTALAPYKLEVVEPGDRKEVPFTFPSGEVLWVHRTRSGEFCTSERSCLSTKSDYDVATVTADQRTYVALKTPTAAYLVEVGRLQQTDVFTVVLKKGGATRGTVTVEHGQLAESSIK